MTRIDDTSPHSIARGNDIKIPASKNDTKGHVTTDALEDFVLSHARGYATKADLSAQPAALRSTSALYSTLARTTAGDGGGGLWTWIATDLSTEVTADPGQGAYVPPSDDTDGSSGAYKRMIADGMVDVRWFGATGASDDTTAFQRANTFANSIGAAMFIPPEIDFRLEGWSPLANTRVVGAGHRLSVIKRKASSATNVGAITITVANVTFEHICFDGDKAGQTKGANTVTVSGSGAYGAAFRFCRFTGAKVESGGYGDGLIFQTTGDNSNEHGADVFGCVFEANDTDGIGLKETYNASITNNIFRQNGGSGISVANFDSPVETASQRVLLVAHNLCVDNSGSGIVIHGFTTGSSTSTSPIWGNASQTTWHAQIIANRCRHNDQYGIAYQASHGVVMANVCADNGGTSYIYGGILFNADYSTCSGNVCYNNEYYGIDAGGAYRCEIVNNVCELNGAPSSSNGGTGINLGAARDTRCAGNHSFNNGDSAAGTQILMSRTDAAGSGLGYAWDADQNVIEENYVACANNNQVGIWLKQGPTNCIVRNNVGRGGTENNYILLEATAICEGNRHVSFIGGSVIASASSVVIPDYAENIVITGTTDITGGFTPYSRNAYSGKIAWVAMTNRGSGYTSAPTVGISGGAGSGFAATAYITNDGKVAGVIVTNGGSGMSGAETITFTGGGGTGAAATPQFGVPNIVGGPRRVIFASALTVRQGGSTFLRGSQFRSDSTGRTVLSLYGFYGTNFHEISRADDPSAEPRGFRNFLINGDVRSWQRGTTFDSTTTPANNDSTYLPDMFYLLSDGNDIVDVSRESTIVPTGSRYAIKADVQTANKKFGFAQIIETNDALRLTGKPFTLSFKARKGSSNVTVDRIKYSVLAWTGTQDTFSAGARDFVNVWGAEGTLPTLNTNWANITTPGDSTLTTSFQTFSLSGISAGTYNNLAVFIWIENDDGTVSDTVYITDVQLEEGYVASAFERIPVQQNLALCQRFYRRDGIALAGRWSSASVCILAMQYSPQMRANPTVALLTTAPVVGEFGISNRTGSGSTIVASTKNASGIMLSIDGFSSATANNSAQGGSTNFLESSAEF